MELQQLDIDYFEHIFNLLPRYWRRFGVRPDFSGKKVLDLGCGHGAMCIDIALCGARRVVGIDLDQYRIDFANTYVNRYHPDLAECIEFFNADVRTYPEYEFDYMVSRKTFEHVIDLAGVLAAMRDRLRPDGKLFTGFGPLYYSPFGDHGWTKSWIPWGHVLQTDNMIIKRLNRTRSQPIEAIYDLGLNKLTPAEYRRIFRKSGLEIVQYTENSLQPDASLARRMIARALNAVKTIPFLEKYVTVNIWCVLEKKR